jgi:hypothetical protein
MSRFNIIESDNQAHRRSPNAFALSIQFFAGDRYDQLTVAAKVHNRGLRADPDFPALVRRRKGTP